MSHPDDCQKPSCEILKPHRHIPGGVFFDWDRERKRLLAEIDALRTERGTCLAHKEQAEQERDRLREALAVAIDHLKWGEERTALEKLEKCMSGCNAQAAGDSPDGKV